MKKCVFCQIIAGEVDADVVYEDQQTLVFLDNRPLFPGHLLVVPRQHTETLPELAAEVLPHFFTVVQRVAAAVPEALAAQGTFVAMNNKVSQSVPHLHCHVVPRNKKDGLRGFFWPRNPYRDDQHKAEVAALLRRVLSVSLRGRPPGSR